jgi:hypothetical protein
MCETNCNHQDIPQPVTVCLKPFLDYRDTTPKPQVIDDLIGDNHLGLETHPFAYMLSGPMKDACSIRPAPLLITHRQCSFHQGFSRRRTQKANRIEQVGFTCRVAPGNASEQSEPDIDIHQILKSSDF